MGDYHDYVFDTENRKFIGRFEEMYENEEKNQYDSWFQDNLTHITKRIAFSILQDYNFSTIADFGCGKGNFTHLLKKKNNKIVGIDISNNAIKKARIRFPELEWRVTNGSPDDFKCIISELNWGMLDLTICIEVLSYMEDWKKTISLISSFSRYAFFSVYLPDNPIGFIKSEAEFIAEVKAYFSPEVFLINKTKENAIYFLGKKKSI